MNSWNQMRERLRRSRAWPLVIAFVWIVGLKILESAPKYDVLFQDFVQMATAGFHREPPLRSDVIVVALTDAAAQKSTLTNARPDRFPRDVLLKVFNEVAKAKPAAIIVDIFFDEQVTGTPLLTRICDSGIRVFLPRDKSPLVPQLAGLPCVQTGAAFYRPDSKGIVRETPIHGEGEKPELTLPAAVARYVSGQTPTGMKQRIFFTASGTNAIKHFYAEGLFEHQGPSVFPGLAEWVKTNSVAIIAPYYSFSDDTFRVPGWAGPSNVVRGGDLLALSVRTFLEDSARNLSSRQIFWFKMILAGLGLAAAKFPVLRLSGDYRMHIVPSILLGAATVAALYAFYIPVAGPVIYYYTIYKVGKEWKRRAEEQHVTNVKKDEFDPELQSGSSV